jgi:hypothetical protein
MQDTFQDDNEHEDNDPRRILAMSKQDYPDKTPSGFPMVPLGYTTVLGEFDLNSISLDISDLEDLGEATDVDINRAFRFINLQKNSNQVQNHYMYYKHTKMKNIDFEAQQPFLEFKPFKVATVYHIEGKENVADILTKPTDGPTFRKHVKAVFMKL